MSSKRVLRTRPAVKTIAPASKRKRTESQPSAPAKKAKAKGTCVSRVVASRSTDDTIKDSSGTSAKGNGARKAAAAPPLSTKATKQSASKAKAAPVQKGRTPRQALVQDDDDEDESQAEDNEGDDLAEDQLGEDEEDYDDDVNLFNEQEVIMHACIYTTCLN